MKKALLLCAMAIAAICCTKPEEEATISIEGRSEYYLDAAGESAVINVKSNKNDWTWDVGGVEWLTATTVSTGLKVNATPNEEYSDRKTTVTVSAGAATASVSVIQMAKLLIPEVTLDIPADYQVPSDGGQFSISVTTNVEGWECVSDCGWFTTSSKDNILILSVEENNSEEDRMSSFTVYAPSSENPLARYTVNLTQAGKDIQYPLETLSSAGSSNCYIITHRGPYEFNATVRGNGKAVKGLSEPEKIAPNGASLVWQTAKGVITNVSYADGKISFEAGKKAGNAVIAAIDANGKILWSWHIWRPSTGVYSIKGKDGSEIMNINLGALTSDCTTVASYGLLYQWGRKDPFPGSPVMDGGNTLTKNAPVYDIDGKEVAITGSSMYNLSSNYLAYSIAHPTECISNNAQRSKCGDWLQPNESNLALWGNPSGCDRIDSKYPNKGSKTYYDPCPVGWRVAHIQTFQHLTETGGMAWASGESEGIMTWADLGGQTSVEIYDYNGDGRVNLLDFPDGWFFKLNKSEANYFPATTRYDGNYALLMGSMAGLWGNYWTNAPYLVDGKDDYKAVALGFGIKEYGSDNYSVTLSPSSYGPRANAYAVRCIKE